MTDYAGAESNYLKASDIKGKTPTVNIVKSEIVKFTKEGQPDEQKPAIFFAGKEKGVVLNKTNTRGLIAAFGSDSDKWVNKDVMLSVVQTEMGDGIRVTPLESQEEDPNDDIPW